MGWSILVLLLPLLAPQAAVQEAEPPPLRLVVNVPAYRLDVYEHGALHHSLTACVGAPPSPTVPGEFAVRRVIWNPWWHPPPSVAATRRVTPPGPANPMGRVKLLYEELYFLHGTPYESSLGHAASLGCVRLANTEAVELARLVQRHAGAAVTDADVDALLADPRHTRDVPLPRPVPLRIVYEIAEVRGGELLFHPDVYGRERGRLRERALDALAVAGIAEDELDAAALDRLLEAAATATASLPLSELRRRPPPPAAPRHDDPPPPTPPPAPAGRR